MTAIRIYGKKGMIECKPFQVNTADDDPEAIAEEDEIINSINLEENNNIDSSEQS